jgi:hypothetical protein
MKRTLTILTVLLLAGGAVFAQARLDAASPKDARSMAMGGSFVAMSEGYQSLYGNPAAFANKKAELTIISANPWFYVKPTTGNIETFQTVADSMGDDPSVLIVPLSDLVTDNGFGAGFSAGMGWVGKGLGLGLLGGGEVFVKGKTLFGARGTLDGQIAAVVGIGVPLNLGPFRLQVGGDVRPYLRMTGEILGTDLLGSLAGSDDFDFMDVPVDVGFGLAVDLGATMEVGKFVSVGLAIRDISTKQNLSRSTVGAVLESSGGLPTSETTNEYTMNPNITIGASVTPIPVFLRKLVDVTVTAELQDPVRVIADDLSIWNLFHVGAEADLLGGLFALRTGVNRGYISVGAGLDLLLLEVNVAVFTEELGRNPGDQGRTGISAEVAIRF